MHLSALAAYESTLCVRCNRLNRRRLAGPFFAAISRLGDGVFWYCLMVMMVLVYGDWQLTGLMCLTGAASTLVYRWLKLHTQRPRPCETYTMPHLTVAPLDRFSFPSGHTLHAVGFTLLVTHAHSELGWFLIPFASLVACSRLVLGLHYPSDVLSGAAIGSLMATAAIYLANG
jgi:undecaprenyl-diphosphatase